MLTTWPLSPGNKFLNISRDRMRYVLIVMDEWSNGTTLSVIADKTPVMIFTRKYKITLPETLKYR